MVTSLQDRAGVRVGARSLESRAVPAIIAQLKLTLVQRDLDALQGGSGDVRMTHADVEL